MKQLRRAFIISTIAFITACTNSGDLSGTNGGTDGQNGLDDGGLGDPTSTTYFQQTVGDRVYFAVDQSTLDDQSRAALNGQAHWLLTNSDYTIIIEGHADEQGTREYNVALGARRANAVKEYLNSLGISADRVRTVSYGKERPIELCSDESCYSVNRRAVTVLNSFGS